MTMFNTIKREFQYGDQQVVIETGRIARQANSILVHMGGVTVLVAAVVKSDTAVCQSHPIRKVCGRYAPERSLAPLVSCYRTETLLVIDTFPTRQLSLSYKKSRHSASTLMYLSYTQRCRVYGV